MRFPPSKKISELVEYPSINLKKKGVSVSFEKWDGNMDHTSELTEVWINMEGIPIKWCSWKVIAQISSSLGVLVNVDWHKIFRSFLKTIRVKVAVRDVSKIPKDRIFEMEQFLYLVDFEVEEPLEDDGGEDGDDPNDQDREEDEGLGEDFQDLIDK